MIPGRAGRGRGGARWRLALGGAAMVGLALSACGGGDSGSATSAGSKAPVKLAVITSITGSLSPFGTANEEGVKVAVDYVNGHGGIDGHPIDMTYYDDQSRPEQASQLAQQVVADKDILACLCFTSSLTETPGAKVLEAQGMPGLIFTGAIPSSPTWSFTVVPGYPIQATSLLRFVKESLHLSRFGLVYSPDLYGKSHFDVIDAQYKNYGLTMVGSEQAPSTTSDFTPAMSRLVQGGAQALIAIMPTQNSVAVTNWGGLGKPVPLVLGLTGAQYAAIQPAGHAADGLYALTTLDNDSPLPRQKLFVDGYKAMFGHAPPVGAGWGWDYVLMIEKLYKQGDTTRQKLRDGFEAIQGYQGADGVYTFSKSDHSGFKGGVQFIQYVGDQKYKLIVTFQ